ncbi:SCO7613 C-terminal domain-containing membrane protein [Streptomyces sp. NPDC059909]|uniref:SCO7613 C-terminal domain-containing membrane protein n=1 Tax=Streptomyces sp. NPDC059909 TaxID=3346998 RepID=UPI003653D8C6
MENELPPAEELRLLDGELAQLDARRAQLLVRRAWLVQTLQAMRTAHRPSAAAGAGGPGGPGGQVWPPRPAPDTSPPSAQNVLLTLGGILLTIAAIAFTLVSWGHMGIGGRSLVLGAVTVAALATPVLLLRRGLTSTAESVAALGLVLMVLDAYALRRAALPQTHAVGYAAVASGALAALWAAYGLALRKLRTPLPVAVVTVQLPLPLWALAADASAWTIAWATLATAALDVAIALAAKPAAVRGLAVAGAVVTGGWSLLTGLWLSVSAGTAAEAVEPCVLLLAAAALALVAAWRTTPAPIPTTTPTASPQEQPNGPQTTPSAARATAAAAMATVAGLALIAGIGGVLRPAMPDDWAVPGYLVCAVALLALLAVVRTRATRGILLGLGIASALVHGAATAWALPYAATTLLTPVTVVDDVWSGAAGLTAPPPGTDTAPLVLAAVAVVLWAVPRLLPGVALPRTAMSCIALVLAWGAAFAVPATLSLPYAATLAVQLVVVTAASAPAVRAGARDRTPGGDDAGRPRPGATAFTALVCGLAGGLSVALLGLATRPATFAVLGVLTVVTVAAAFVTRASVQAVLACTAVVWATGLVGATAAAAGLPAHQAAVALLAVPAATALLTAIRLRRHAVALPVELTGAVAGLVAIGLAVPHAPTLALVLALAGVVAAGTAVRAERRPAAGYVAAVLFVAATWVRLAASDVSTPEAYTLPVTVPALALGLLRRRRDPEASSWVAYGPGLAATLVPSLFAAWGDPHWLRPLLLGAAALAVTLAGARLRLQALLVLGGLTLTLDALHELAPYVVQVVGALPRWLPPALAGLLLLAVGATYEQRLRDARRLRDTLTRMR